MVAEVVTFGDILLEGNDSFTIEELSTVRKLLISSKTLSTGDYDNFISIFLILIRSLRAASGVGDYRVKCCDCIAIWLLRSTQLSAGSRDYASLFKKKVDLIGSSNFFFQYVVDYWNETGSPLSNSLRDLFTKLIIALKPYDSQELYKKWLDQAMKISKNRRVLYLLVDILTREIRDQYYIVSQYPDFIQVSIGEMESRPMSNVIGKALSCIYKGLYIDEDHSERWVTDFWGPVFDVMKSDNILLKSSVERHLLPNLFKCSRNAFKIFIEKIKDDLELYITCLNIGKMLVIEEDPFPNIISEDMIQQLIVHPEFKVKSLQLLTFSAKGSKPIKAEVFDVLEKNLEMFFVDFEVETRNEFISIFKQFIYRIKDASYALNRDAKKLQKHGMTIESNLKNEELERHQIFLKRVIELIKYQIKPGSQYQRTITGLKLLEYLVDTGLDARHCVSLNINYPFEIEIFDGVCIQLLFSNLINTYDDVRNSAAHLLVKSKVDISESEKRILLNKGFEMLRSYNKSELGAKVLECLYVLFQEDNIMDRLVETIPLQSDITKAVNHPVDGYFNTMHLILIKNKNYGNQEKFIQMLETNWHSVKEILSNDSPEGCDLYGVGSYQLVLSYAWRSTKESTVLLQVLLDLELTDDQILRIGDLVLDQLSTVRHRGAFSSVYPTFMKVAALCRLRIPGQNLRWLNQNIELIQKKTQLITRRSGGLPFLITAIITVEKELMQYSFDKLIEIAKAPINEKDESEKMDIPQVHAFNCLKALFTESQLSETCAQYVYQALELALNEFSSSIWSIRNCSIMLFTALQNRLFGKKKINARVFFSRYKGIKQILIEILSTSIEKNKLETLFPVLTILSKLEVSSGLDDLQEFKPLLRVCLSTKYWKIREAASRALPSLITYWDSECLDLLTCASISNQNQLHGHLLAIKVLRSYSEKFIRIFYSQFGTLFLQNPSHSTRKVYIEILAEVLQIHYNEGITSHLQNWFLNENSVYECDGAKQLLLKEIFKILVNFKSSVLESGLASKFYEVQLEAISFCERNKLNHESLAELATCDETWTFVRSKAIPLVECYSIDKLFDFVINDQDYGEDIKRSGLELLGSIIGNGTGSDNDFKKWIKLIEQNSDEDVPSPVRFSALKSVSRFLKKRSDVRILWLAYLFLSDDDENIRQFASSIFSNNTIPWHCADKFSKSFGTDEQSASVVFEQFMNFEPQFEYNSAPGEIIFAVERKNLYRNYVEQNWQLLIMLKNAIKFLNSDQKIQIKSHVHEISHKLSKLVNGHDINTLLGWSSYSDLYEEACSSLYYLNELKSSNSKTFSLCDELCQTVINLHPL